MARSLRCRGVEVSMRSRALTGRLSVPRGALLLPMAASALVLLARTAAAATLMVGPGQMYTTPCAAIAAASVGDEIDIAAGTYNDSCTISTAGLHLKGVGGRPKIDLTDQTIPNEKGIYAVEADDVVIENLELMGAQIPSSEGENGAGLRIQSNGVVVTNCYIHDNQNGILSGPLTAGTGTQTIDHTEFANNSLGMGCFDGNSCTHNVYVGDYARLIFQFNYTHLAGADTGHLLKSRALENDVLYNRITGETGLDSYEVNLPTGGLGILIGNVIEKGPMSSNSGTSVFFCDTGDGCVAGTNTLFAANNTFVNDNASSTTFIRVGSVGTLATATDNIFSGMGTPSSTGALSADNLSGVDPLFVNPAMYDYHLTSGSPAIGKGVAEGSAGTFPLTPAWEYVDPVSGVPRLTAKDVGAFEYGTNVSDPSMDAGAETPDGAVTSSSSGGSSDAGHSSSSSSGSSSGSGSSGSGGGSGSGSGGAGAGSSGGSGGGSATADGGTGGGSGGSGAGCTIGYEGRTGVGLVGAFVGLALALSRFGRRRR
jgi:uncharacterized membrane protein YgcG